MPGPGSWSWFLVLVPDPVSLVLGPWSWFWSLVPGPWSDMVLDMDMDMDAGVRRDMDIHGDDH